MRNLPTNLLTSSAKPSASAARKGSTSPWLYYAVANGAFALILLGIASAAELTGHDPYPYLVFLFAICTIPLLSAKYANGPNCLLVIALPFFFTFFGLTDVLEYVGLPRGIVGSADTVFTDAEIVILFALSAFTLGYKFSLAIFKAKKPDWLTYDWRPSSLIVMGIILTGIGLAGMTYFQINFQVNGPTVTLSPLQGTVMMLSRMMEPVGEVLLIYGFLRYRSRLFLLIVVALAVIKLPMGILFNSKEVGVSVISVLFVATWIYSGRIPWTWLIVGSVVIVLYFPLVYAYRNNVLAGGAISVQSALNNAEKNLGKASDSAAKESGGTLIDKIAPFAGRVNFKDIVELAVSKIPSTAPTQEGATLEPLLYVFIPRLLLPDKPYVPVAQLFNRQLHISADPNTHISTTFIGELYWNYLRDGAIIGMFIVGMSFGAVGAVANMEATKSVSRLLILVTAIYTLVLRFEGAIAQQYSLFLRSVLIIIILHYVFRSKKTRRS